MKRCDGRDFNEVREISITRGFTSKTPGSVLIRAGETMILCTASLSASLPPWMNPDEARGWTTAEYNMLPGSTSPRKGRDRAGKIDGRSVEIQRLVGRSLRAAIDLKALGPRMLNVDCDVLQADGGTRTLSVTGAAVAAIDALRSLEEFANRLPGDPGFPMKSFLAAVSVGIVDGVPLLDLCYEEDAKAEVDMNIVMTDADRFVEVQGTGEEATFSENQLAQMLGLAKKGIHELIAKQKALFCQ
ncbi:MAG: ribonuclease PH [Planctomycetia bacterium]|nr:ribonuclease PH [Planctomycetia bacterium]